MMAKSDSKLYLQTTEVSAAKSIGEITAVLVNAGARSIQTLYGEGAKPIGLEWSMLLYDRPVYFRLPVKIEPVYQVLKRQTTGFLGLEREKKLHAQAERIAWRQMLAWVKLQTALVELGMVEYAEVFFPYVQNQPGGKTMWEVAAATQFKALPAPEGKQ